MGGYLAKAEASAVELLEKFNITTAPVNVSEIAERLGVLVRYEDLEDSLSGFLVIKNNVKTVVINKYHHVNRQRFTLAHELGHLRLHVVGNNEELFLEKRQVYNRDLISSTGNDVREMQANRFAAACLMPKKLIHDYLEKENNFMDDYSGDSNSIRNLSKKFQVSEAALAHRLSALYIDSSSI